MRKYDRNIHMVCGASQKLDDQSIATVAAKSAGDRATASYRTKVRPSCFPYHVLAKGLARGHSKNKDKCTIMLVGRVGGHARMISTTVLKRRNHEYHLTLLLIPNLDHVDLPVGSCLPPGNRRSAGVA
jgi:hypothetical protein